MSEPLLRVENLVVRYRKRGLFAKLSDPAVNNVSVDLKSGNILGVVGESGSGKSTLLRAILRLIPSESGNVIFDGTNWLTMKKSELRLERQKFGVVAQNPFLSLSPRLNVLQILSEPLTANGRKSVETDRIVAQMENCGLPGDFLYRRAHELSGGQAQRVAIVRALMQTPKLLILDEPTSALDISVQAQILNLLMDIQKRLGISMILVTHDLGVVRHIANDILVMRNGKVVEKGATHAVIASPQESYTRELLASLAH